MSHKVLIVDDEATLRYFLRLELEGKGYDVTEAENGEKALEFIKANPFDVALVDLRMAGVDGLEVMRQLHQQSPQTKVIILTAYASLSSAIEALRHDAHDYVIKPFDTEELLASVADAIASQAVEGKPPESKIQPLVVGGLTLDPASRQVIRDGQALQLTPTEFDLLACLMSSPNVALDAVTLLRKVRGYEATETDARSIVRVHIHRLRQKLEPDPARPRYVTTVAGGRYLLPLQ
ncbi:MAG: response regulator transcription factor [Anaerolineae bacterium]